MKNIGRYYFSFIDKKTVCQGAWKTWWSHCDSYSNSLPTALGCLVKYRTIFNIYKHNLESLSKL